MKNPHIRIEPMGRGEIGDPHVVVHDRIVAVGVDGTEVELDAAVRSWTLTSKAGDVRLLTLELLRFEVEETDRPVDTDELDPELPTPDLGPGLE